MGSTYSCSPGEPIDGCSVWRMGSHELASMASNAESDERFLKVVNCCWSLRLHDAIDVRIVIGHAEHLSTLRDTRFFVVRKFHVSVRTVTRATSPDVVTPARILSTPSSRKSRIPPARAESRISVALARD